MADVIAVVADIDVAVDVVTLFELVALDVDTHFRVFFFAKRLSSNWQISDRLIWWSLTKWIFNDILL